ncbi:hypothetical protein PG990_013061 [Apiospora arundinis]
MATFHPFPRLPAELRALVWQMTVEPRVVEINVSHKRNTLNNQVEPYRLVLSTPVPAELQTCHEARNLGLYQRHLSEFPVALLDPPSQNDTRESVPPEQQRRYIWLNWDIDTIYIGLEPICEFSPIAHRIKRLRMERVWDTLDESHDLCSLVNVEEIHIVCVDGIGEWGGLWQDRLWPCENVFFIDDADGQTMRAAEIDTWHERFQEAD